MKYKILLFSLLLTIYSHTQEGFAVSVGGVYSHLQFKVFEEYVNSYNLINQNNSNFEELKYNPTGFGISSNFQYRIGKMYSAINISKSKNIESIAKFENGSRSFVFKNNTFDVIVGGKIKFFTPYITMSINSLNIESFFKYKDGTISYGSEYGISGIYSSFKMFMGIGVRFEKRFNKFGVSLDGCYPINAKKYLGDTFNKQTNSTNAPYFPQNHINYGSMEVDQMMPQTYRNIRFGLSLIYYLNQKSE